MKRKPREGEFGKRRQRRISARCPRCQVWAWGEKAHLIVERQRDAGRVRYRLLCPKCGHEWWLQRAPRHPTGRGYAIILRLCGIPWKARALLNIHNTRVCGEALLAQLGASSDGRNHLEFAFSAAEKGLDQKIQARYRISKEKVALLLRALEEYDRIMTGYEGGCAEKILRQTEALLRMPPVHNREEFGKLLHETAGFDRMMASQVGEESLSAKDLERVCRLAVDLARGARLPD